MRRLRVLALLGIGISTGCAGCGETQDAAAPPSPQPTPVLSPEQQAAVNAAKERSQHQAAATQRPSPR